MVRMSERKSDEDIRQFWDRAATVSRDEDGLRPVARDPHLQQAVEEAVEPWLNPGASALDVGCGDGLSTLRFARRVKSIVGVDYIPRFVDKARAAASQQNAENARFLVGNALDLAPIRAELGGVDIAISIRCLINLNTWEKQCQAIHEVALSVRPGGLYILSEGWSNGLNGLNSLRLRARLEPISTVSYNLLLNRENFETAIAGHFRVENYVNIGFYLVMSRVLQPLIEYPNPARHDHPINKLAASLQKYCSDPTVFSEYDYTGVYVLRRLD
jgi:SAM-dependent methyltransferase